MGTTTQHLNLGLDMWVRGDRQQAKAQIVCSCGAKVTGDLIEGPAGQIRARLTAEQNYRNHVTDSLMKEGLFSGIED